MFRITEDPSSGSLVQCLAKNYKYDSIMSVGTYFVHFNGHDRIYVLLKAKMSDKWFFFLFDISIAMILITIN